MTFIPLSSVSPSYQRLQNDLATSIGRETAARKYSASIQKQHAIQLDHIANQEPSIEQVLLQCALEFPSMYIVRESLIREYLLDPSHSAKARKEVRLAHVLTQPSVLERIHGKFLLSLSHAKLTTK